MKEKCLACKETSLAIEDHHISYYPEIKIRICANCHFITHHPPDDPKDFESLPKQLRELTKANIERKAEQERTLGCSLDSKEIDLEMQKERLVLMKLINRHWELRNTIQFNEIYPPIPLINYSDETHYRIKEKIVPEREEFKKRFLIPTQKGENEP
jgi:hypothetical protein